MATPLSPAPSAALNFSTPTANLRHDPYDANTENRDNDAEDGDSSPFLSHIKDELTSPTSRRPSPPKARPGSRIISGSELSPLKILQQQQQSQIQAQTQTQLQQSPPQSSVSDEPTPSPAKTSMAPPPLPQSPRKSAPIKRFPVKVSQPGAAVSAANESPRRSLEEREERRPSTDRTNTLEVVRENEGLKHAIDIFEDEVNAMHDDVDHDGDHTMSLGHDDTAVAGEDHSAAADDSMISTFSAFSGVPNLTMLAQMRSDSPTKLSVLGGDGFATPRASAAQARTPRANGSWDAGNSNNSNTTTNLMDFTEQMRYGAYGAQPTPSRRGPGPMAAANLTTPQRPPGSNNNLATLLDFDIPPAPTPRSIPTITPRELESLKSGFLSEISSLKASLSGKEAEVSSLKTAVGDAEKRVGECLEQLREVEGVQGALRGERDSWERRGREMEAVLRKVKEEIVISQREREELEFKLDEADKRREAAEMMAQEAESKMAGMRAGKASAEAAAAAAAVEGGSKYPGPVPSNKEVEMAVERVARELHALYKSKHETKVAALKKSYEARWEKRVRQLQAQVDELRRENEEVARHHRASPDSHNGGGADAAAANARLAELEEARRAERARDAARIRELEATVEKVEAVLKTVQADNAELRVLLERERVEKGELVQLAEEMMEMQQSFVGGGGGGGAAAASMSLPEAEEPHHQQQYQQQQEQQQQQQPQRPMQTPSTSTAKTPSRRQSGGHNNNTATSGMPTRTPSNGPHNNNNFRMSTLGGGGGSNFRASGLRAPGGGMMGLSGSTSVSRISGIGGGRAAAHERTKSAAVLGTGGGMGIGRPGSGSGAGAGQGRPGSGQGLRSSIEKMGMGVGGGYGGGYGYGGRRGE